VARIARPEGAKSAILMVGIPASGKSTFVTRLESRGYERLSLDVVRGEMYGDENIQGDGRKVKARFMEKLVDALVAGRNVVLDNTHFSFSARRAAVEALREHGYNIRMFILNVPLEECILRNARRDRVVDEQVLRDMHATLWEKGGLPTTSEGRLTFVTPAANGRYNMSAKRPDPSSHR